MSEIKLNTIEEAIEDFKEGKFIIVVDDEDRENEGDLIIAAEKVTPEKINFMLKNARGVLCAPITISRCEELDLPHQVSNNTSVLGTPFTVTIDKLEGCSTGVSAKDRAETIKVIRGESPLNAQLLNSLMSEAADRLRAAQAREEEAQASLDDLLASAQSIRDEYDQLLSWADLYSKSSFEARKMILSQLIDSVYVGRDYRMEINFKFSFDEFNTQPLPFYSLRENAGA